MLKKIKRLTPNKVVYAVYAGNLPDKEKPLFVLHSDTQYQAHLEVKGFQQFLPDVSFSVVPMIRHKSML
jgi:hypothetical protein